MLAPQKGGGGEKGEKGEELGGIKLAVFAMG